MNPVFYYHESENESGRAWVTIDNPPSNSMSLAVRTGLIQAIARAERDHCRTGIIVCLGKTFIADSETSDAGESLEAPLLAEVCSALEQSPVIWATALHGTVSGEGFELAMASHVRVATRATQFSLPEMNQASVSSDVGQRLSRLVGERQATEFDSNSHLIDAQALFAAGGLNLLVDDDLDTSVGELLDVTNEHPFHMLRL